MTMQKYKLFLIWYIINLYIVNVREVLLFFLQTGAMDYWNMDTVISSFE